MTFMSRIVSALISALLLMTGCENRSPEPVLADIASAMVKKKQQMQKDCPECEFYAFWDFDGTLLRGDCSEGYESADFSYPGLVERFVLEGYSKLPANEQGVNQYWKTYKELDETQGHVAAYTYLPELFAGQREADMVLRSQAHFKNDMKQFLFADSLSALRMLEENGIKNYILSASADFFVKGAASSLGLDPARMNGIRLQTADGVLQDRERLPVTYADGKTKVMQEIISSSQKPVILGAFGNSYHTDGHFMKTAAENYGAVSVMINGGETPAEFTGLFSKINLSRTAEKP